MLTLLQPNNRKEHEFILLTVLRLTFELARKRKTPNEAAAYGTYRYNEEHLNCIRAICSQKLARVKFSEYNVNDRG